MGTAIFVLVMNCAVNLNKISSDEPETIFVMEIACERKLRGRAPRPL